MNEELIGHQIEVHDVRLNDHSKRFFFYAIQNNIFK